MKLVLSAEGVKREIIGPFSMCASAHDLDVLRQQLDRALTDDFTYGWITIWPSPAEAPANTPPLPWSAR